MSQEQAAPQMVEALRKAANGMRNTWLKKWVRPVSASADYIVDQESRLAALQARVEALEGALRDCLSLLRGEKETEHDLTLYGPGGRSVVRLKRVITQAARVLQESEQGRTS